MGTGPGAFTGLRVGIATAKGLAHGLGRPIVGVSTGGALLSAAAADLGVAVDQIVAAPAGRAVRPDRRATRRDARAAAGRRRTRRSHRTRSWSPSTSTAARPMTRASAASGHATGLRPSCSAIGAARIAAGEVDDLARLVPEYVTLPRGAAPSSGEVAWSRDPR